MGDGTIGRGVLPRLRVDRARIREFASFLGSVLAVQGSRFVFTLLVAAALPPGEFTVWAQFVTFIGYAPSQLLGVANGMNRAIPIHLGRGDGPQADNDESGTWWMLAASAVVGVAAAAALSRADVVAWLPAAVIAGCLMTVYQVQQFAMRSRLIFARASAQQWAWAGAMAVGGFTLQSLPDRSLGTVFWIWIAGAMAAVVVGFALRRPILRRPSPARTWGLLTMGFPIMLAGLIGTFFFTADRWVAAARLTPASAGSYGLASLIAAAVLLVPTVIAQQQYPRMAMLHGEGASATRLAEAARHLSLAAVGASLVTGLGVALFTFLIAPHVLPAYQGLGPLTAILTLGITALAGGIGYGNLLIVTGAVWTFLGIQVSCFAIALALMALGSELGGEVGLALGVAAGQIILLTALGAAARTVVARRDLRA